MDNYEKFLMESREQKADPDRVSAVKEKILQATGSSKRIVFADYIHFLLYSWIEIRWLRRSLVFASAIVLVMIFVQQAVVIERIDTLEKRIISTNTTNILEFQKETMHANSMIYTITDSYYESDSVSVSTRDLVSLVKSYRELQAKYDELKKSAGSFNADESESIISNGKRQKL